MAHGLVRADTRFGAYLARLLDVPGCGDRTLHHEWIDPTACPGFDDADHSQPMLLALGMALAQELAHRGVVPAAVAGHSVGEVAAAWVAGVFSADQDVALVRSRQSAVGLAGYGAMLAVLAGPDVVRSFLVPGAVIGAVNTRRQVVVSGRHDAVAATGARMQAAGHAVHAVRTDRAFHSPLCADAASAFTQDLEQLGPGPARLPVFSGRTGREADAGQASTPGFWGGQLAEPVLFDAAVTSLVSSSPGRWIIVEVGPPGSVRAMLRRHPSVRSGRAEVVSVLPPVGASEAHDVEHLDRLAESLRAVKDAGTRSRTWSPPSSRR